MSIEIIHEAPTDDSFIPLSTHQSQTPRSFFSGPPVLYYLSLAATLKTQANELASFPTLQSLFEHGRAPVNGTRVVNGDPPVEEENCEVEAQGVDVWVSSERFILFSVSKQIGLSVPYPSISLHAIQGSNPPSLFLQLLTHFPTFDDHGPDATISLTIVPAASSTESIDPEATGATTAPQEPAQLLYTALSDCANLHPDPASSGSDNEEGGAQPNLMFERDGDTEAPYALLNGTATTLPPPIPGSGGWITAENVGDFFDEEGNWRGGRRVLGEGAGSVRQREEEGEGVNGGGPRAEGEGEETKWRRTG